MFSRHATRAVRALALLFVLTLPLLACKKKQPQQESSSSSLSPEEHALLKTQSDQLDALILKVKAEPDVTTTDAFATSIKKDEVAVVGQAWLEEPDHKADEATELELGSFAIQACKAGSNTDKRSYYDECSKWRYIAVLRQKRYARPTISDEDKRFEKGVFEGDLLVAELSTGDIKGRYVVRVQSSDELEVLNTLSKYEVQRRLDTDLRVKLRDRVTSRLSDLSTSLEEH
ncbi:MAG: hypothetical protein AB7S68_22650 [Polyangiaceae bacterium]